LLNDKNKDDQNAKALPAKKIKRRKKGQFTFEVKTHF